MLCDVSAICSQAEGLQAMGSRILRRVCHFNGWLAGGIYLESNSEAPLREVASFREDGAPGPSDAVFLAVAKRLLSRVAHNGDSAWASPAGEHRAEDDLFTWVCAPIKVESRMLGALILASEAPVPDGDEIRGALESVAIQFGSVVRRHETARLLDSATRAERNRIGRDLHDTVAQDLAGLGLVSANSAKRLEDRDDREAEVVRSVSDRLTTVVENIRSIVRGLLPVGMESGLPNALRRLCEDAADTHDTRCVAEIEEIDIDEAPALHLFLIAREALLNSMRHGGATEVVVRLYRQGEDIVLEIRDDGRGFDDAARVAGGSGLTIIRHRASLIDGRVSIASEQGRGTTVRCVVSKQVAP